MAVARGPKLETLTDGSVGAEVAAREREVRARASALAAKRSAPVDPIVDWLEAERLVYRRPSVRLSLDGDRYRIELELPGVANKDVAIRAGDGRIVVEASRPAAPGVAIVDEFGTAGIWRDVTLPPDAIASSLAAALKDGLLVLTIDRRAAPVEAPPLLEAPISATRVTKRPAKRAPSKKPKNERAADAD
jgi:HSP20 family protein